MGTDHNSMSASSRRIVDMNAEVSRLCGQGKHAAAVEVAKQALALAREDFAANLPASESHSDDLRELGRAARNILSIGGVSFPGAGLLMDVMGRGIQALMEDAEAQAQLKKVLELRRRALGSEDTDLINNLSSLAMVFQEMGQYEKARSFMESAVAISREERGAEHFSTATYLNYLGKLLQEGGDYGAAEDHFERALMIRRSALGESHPDTAATRHDLGNLLLELGDFARAWAHLDQAFNARSSVLGKGHALTADTLRSMGMLRLEIGDPAGARTYLDRAYAIRGRALPDDHVDEAGGLSEKAVVFHELGDDERARLFMETALLEYQHSLGETHLRTASCRKKLGRLYRQTGAGEMAYGELERALLIRRRMLGDDHPHTASCLLELGELSRELGDDDQAWHLVSLALKTFRRTYGEHHPATTSCLALLAVLCAAKGRPGEALTLVQQAVAGEDRLLGQVFTIASARQRAQFLERTRFHLDAFLSLVVQHFSDSSAAVSAAFDIVMRRKSLGAEALAVQRDAVLSGRYPHLGSRLRELTALRMRVARKMLSGPGPEGAEGHQRLLDRWDEQKQRLEVELASQVPEMNLDARLQVSDHRAVALALPSKSCLVEFVRFLPLDFSRTATTHEPALLRSRYLAFVLPAGEPDGVRMIDLGEAEVIDRLVAEFRAGITGEAELHAGRVLNAPRDMAKHPADPLAAVRTDAGRALHAVVLEPLLAALKDRRQLLLAPDGDLTRLPFESLPQHASGRLIDDFALSYLTCGRDVLRFGVSASGDAGGPIVIADPEFNLSSERPTEVATDPCLSSPPRPRSSLLDRLLGRRRSAPVTAARPPAPRTSWAPGSGRRSRYLNQSNCRFEPLPGTRAEGQRIADLLKVQPWLGPDAMEGRLKVKCRSPHTLHVASHGFFLEDQLREPKKGVPRRRRDG
jgi:tetratricopeptide (TPR) repeat protein